jgi:hypothetical protein
VAQPEAVRYLALPDKIRPRALARIRWPDLAQAMTAAHPVWKDDPALFDLLHSHAATPITAAQATKIASSWGASLNHETQADSTVRLSDKQPRYWKERKLRPDSTTWGGDGTEPPELPLPSFYMQRSVPAAVNGATNGAPKTDDRPPAVAVERRRHTRVGLDGLAQIKCGERTVRAELVDVSPGGLRCIMIDSGPGLDVGTRLSPSLVLEQDRSDTWTSLGVVGTVVWNSRGQFGVHIGVAFENPRDN